MLVLSRHANETIRIGDDIVVSVQRISGNRVIIGIDAPQEVAIRRGELAFDGDSLPASDAAPTARAPQTRASKSHSPQSGSPDASPARGLTGRVRGKSHRSSSPVVVPMGDRTSDWSASHIS